MIDEILRQIHDNHTFLITAHESPDGDAIGSSLGLAVFLQELGKKVTVHLADGVPPDFMFLPMADQVVRHIPEGEYDICFVLDVGEFRRAGTELTSCTRIRNFINIDHHLSCEHFGLINLIDSDAAATGVLIYRIVKASGHTLSKEVATNIYVALITDTGSFRYSNANPEAFVVASEMVAAGVNAWSVAEKLYESQPAKRLQLLARALNTLEIRGPVASVTVTLEMYRETETGPDFTDGFVNYPRSIDGVEVAIFFRETKPDEYKVGFRSKGKVNVSRLAGLFGGGGHHNAAGCTVNGTLDEVKEIVYARLAEAF